MRSGSMGLTSNEGSFIDESAWIEKMHERRHIVALREGQVCRHNGFALSGGNFTKEIPF